MSLIDLVIVYLWVIPTVVLALLARLVFQVKTEPTPWRRKNILEIKPLFPRLLRLGYDKGYFLLTHEDGDRFLKCRKYLYREGDYGIELIVPQVAETKSYLPELERYCDEIGFSLRETTECLKDSSTDAIVIDAGLEMDQAFELAVKIWTEYLGLQTDSWFEFSAGGFSIGGEFVRKPGHPRPSNSERQLFRSRRVKRSLRHNTGMKPVDVIIFSMIVTVFLLCLIGLPVSTAMSLGTRPDWSIDIAGLEIGGSVASLTFNIIYVLALTALFEFFRKLKPRRKQEPKTMADKLILMGLRTVVLTLPLVVILVWSAALADSNF